MKRFMVLVLAAGFLFSGVAFAGEVKDKSGRVVMDKSGGKLMDKSSQAAAPKAIEKKASGNVSSPAIKKTGLPGKR